ncbi:hypothetical protein PILCRDRAFT_816031 [Piloderma croceum F 1598]|uniref:RING-type domain-containing protein n=1 Tax=Piloderma croceum (strain F 1598) TaxID=765440 RepID=A0A0C3G4N2_PILCF|nr:hypothetical protein PILCRDRAFT_816031 [Piloderma croceum F 1598]
MSDGRRGLPLLSGQPPPNSDLTRAEIACRKCNKEFNILFTRKCKCNHCGYSYCSSCCDYQALMPRTTGDQGYQVTQTGYDVSSVCGYCIENLNITAAGRGQLRTFPLSRLRKYVEAYNIKVNGAIEKDDYIDHIIRARGPNGCLLVSNEEYYRKYSVPNRPPGSRPRGIFSRLDPTQSSQPYPPPRTPPNRPQYQRPAFPRPDLEPDYPPPQQYQPPPGPPPSSSSQRPAFSRPDLEPDAQQPPPHTSPQQSQPRTSPRPAPSYHHQPPYHTNDQYQQRPFPRARADTHSPPLRPSSAQNLNVPQSSPPPPTRQSTRTRATSASPSPSVHPPTPPPTLDGLLNMLPEGIQALSIGTLKAILFQNHVNARLILEKSDLVEKVVTLVEDERRDRERKAMEEEEEKRAMEEEQRMKEERQRQEEEDKGKNGSTDSAKPTTLPPKAQAMAATLARTGLCVICQDEEANIAIVDCGHLAMCRGCSDLIMNSSRECPLCRTRIVTEQRLLRIYKT